MKREAVREGRFCQQLCSLSLSWARSPGTSCAWRGKRSQLQKWHLGPCDGLLGSLVHSHSCLVLLIGMHCHCLTGIRIHLGQQGYCRHK